MLLSLSLEARSVSVTSQLSKESFTQSKPQFSGTDSPSGLFHDLFPLMSPAAVDFRSPFISPSQMQSEQQQSFTPQNPNPSPSLPFGFSPFLSNNLPEHHQSSLHGGLETISCSNVGNAREGGISCAFSSPLPSGISAGKPNFSSVSGRSKPRLVKIRRHIGSQRGKSTSVPSQNDLGLNPFRSVSNNSDQVKNGTSSTSNGFSTSIGDVKVGKLDDSGFVFGASKNNLMSNLNSETKQCSGTLGQASADGFEKFNNVGLVSDFKKSNLDSNSISEHIDSSKGPEKSGINEFGKFENVGFVLGAENNSSSLNSHLENRQRSENREKSGSNEFVFSTNKNSSIANSTSEKRQSSGSVQQSGADEFGEFDNVSFVLGINKNNSISHKNSKWSAYDRSMGQLHGDEVKNIGNGCFVVGSNSSFTLNSKFEKRQYGDSVGKSEAGDFDSVQVGSKPATSASSSKFDTREPSVNMGFFYEGRGTFKEENEADFREQDEKGFVFGARHGDSLLNSNLEKEESNENVRKLASNVMGKTNLDFGKTENVGYVFGGNWSELLSDINSVNSESRENGGNSIPIDRQKTKSGAHLGKLDNLGFVFGTYPKGSLSIPDSQRRESSASAGKLEFEDGGKMKVNSEVEFQKAKANDVFIFASSKKKNSSFGESTKLRGEMNKVNRENFGNFSGSVNNYTDKLGSAVNNKFNFVFGSSGNATSASGSSTVHKISDEMRNLTVDDCEKIDCSNNTKVPNINSFASSNHMFVSGSNKKFPSSCTEKSGTISCDQMKNANLRGPGNADAFENNDRINFRTFGNNNFVFASSSDAACSFSGSAQSMMPSEKGKNTGSRLGVFDEEVKLECPFGSFWEGKQSTNANEKSSDSPSVGISTSKPFTFHAGLGKSSDRPPDQVNNDSNQNKACTQSLSSSFGLGFEAPSVGIVENKDAFNFASTPLYAGASDVDFRTPNGDPSCSFTANLYPGLNKKLVFSEKSRSIRDKRSKRAKGKLRTGIPVQQQSRQNCLSKEGSQQNLESPGCYSPMDFSPYHDNNFTPFPSDARSFKHAKDEDLAAAREGANIREGYKECREPNDEDFKTDYKRLVPDSFLEESETECTKSKFENININGGGVGVSGDGDRSNTKGEESECKKQFCFASSAEDINKKNFTFSASTAHVDFSVTKRQNRKKYKMKFGLVPNCATPSQKVDIASTSKRQNQKKYKMKVGLGPKCATPSQKVDIASTSVQFTPLDSTYLPPNQSKDKGNNLFNSPRKGDDKSKGDEENDKQGSIAAIQRACEKWRIRGNQAYEKGYVSKAEECYTKGINCVPHSETSGCFAEPLVLCYSNRAAARMSSGAMREALGDCVVAAALDPNFHKVQIRAANCHLALGEVEDALQYFRKCLESANDVCLDRRIIIEAANGLQKAQKVSDCMSQCAELLQQRTYNAAISVLEIISGVLPISCYSEKLLEMKGEALLMLRRYEEVIELCEQTLVYAEKNFTKINGDKKILNGDGPKYNDSSMRLWRQRLMSKSYFHLGKLEVALELLEKQEELRSADDRCGSNGQESSIPFAVTVRELLHHKNSGNEAFQSGRHTEALEHYTAAVSNSLESRPFAAICFCNRAAAYQALGQIADAIADCSLSIALDRSYSKAFSRRAALHETIRDFEQAVTDLQRLISLLEKQSQDKVHQSGSNVKEIRQARHRLLSVEEKAKNEISLDHYLILGIKQSDSAPEIKKAYRKAALRHHPDKASQLLARSETGDDGQLWKEIADEVRKDADRLFKMIGEAYAVLSDLTKRSQYDLQEESRKSQESNERRASRGHSDVYGSPFRRSERWRHWQEPWSRSSRNQWKEV